MCASIWRKLAPSARAALARPERREFAPDRSDLNYFFNLKTTRQRDVERIYLCIKLCIKRGESLLKNSDCLVLD